jgi:uncharacterized protein
MIKYILLFLPIVFFGFVSVSIAQDAPPVPALTTRVYDETGSLSAEQKQALEQKLAFYEDSTSTQIVVVIMKTLNGYPVSDFATQIGNANKLGQGKKNNGVVILLSKDEHQGFIATGYGMEPSVTDALAGIIFRDIIRPALRQNDYYGGLSEAIDSLVSAAKGEFKGTGKSSSRKNDIGVGAFIFVIIIFVVIVIIRAAVGAGGRRTIVGGGGTRSGFMGGILQALFWASIFNDRDRRGGSGGGFGGFGGGSFGGGGGGGFSGGGGSFGGGGAGGSW